eukprot:TRINITY_DN61034_c0_g1_i1.p1 TRINITY_DN61034_c0_g1~~TRINITY_DN61034_c0_g1_i1.p1  ORF type:complete len:673 (+),score=140.23 TRINITY_DN61034_c0_g1_i1:71-2089(+)
MAKVSAWSSWSEFEAVYEQLVSTNAEDRAAGLQRIATWRTRARLPVAVDVTASFVEIMLNDSHFNPATKAPRSDHELRLMYAMAVVRLVNGIVDVGHRGSILSRAQGLEWPQWFVDLRHEASHQSLPSLPLLRLAAQEAVWLLVERFWRPQLARVAGRDGSSAAAGAKAKEDRIRGTKTLDRRLRELVRLAAAAGSSAPAARGSKKQQQRKRRRLAAAANDNCLPSSGQGEQDDGGQADPEAAAAAAAEAAAAQAEDCAGAIARLAPDEGRLLERICSVVMAESPHPDGREARAIHLLCESCSENFALRLARRILNQALSLPDISLDKAPDNSPSLRNISDVECAGRSPADPLAPATEIHSDQSALPWLEKLLTLPENDASQVPGRQSDKRFSRFTDATRELLPMFRQFVLQSMANSASTPGAAAAGLSSFPQLVAGRAVQVWQQVRDAGLDAGADLFITLCEEVAAGESFSSELRKPASLPAGMLLTSAAPSVSAADTKLLLGEAEEFVRKASGCEQQRDAAAAVRLPVVPRREPWTAIGTVLDPKTLAIRCRQEATQPKSLLPAGAVEKWLDWFASEGTTEVDIAVTDSSKYDDSGCSTARVRVEESKDEKEEAKEVALPAPDLSSSPLTLADADASSAERHAASPAVSQEEFRQRAAALVEEVRAAARS